MRAGRNFLGLQTHSAFPEVEAPVSRFSLGTSVVVGAGSFAGGWTSLGSGRYQHSIGNTTPLYFPLTGDIVNNDYRCMFTLENLNDGSVTPASVNNDATIVKDSQGGVRDYNIQQMYFFTSAENNSRLRFIPTSDFDGIVSIQQVNRLEIAVGFEDPPRPTFDQLFSHDVNVLQLQIHAPIQASPPTPDQIYTGPMYDDDGLAIGVQKSVAISTGSPCVITKIDHKLVPGNEFILRGTGATGATNGVTMGALPWPLNPYKEYYVSVSGWGLDSFRLSETVDGPVIDTSAPIVTISGIGGEAVFTLADHNFTPGRPIRFATSGALPSGLAVSTTYYVSAIDLENDTFKVYSYDTAEGGDPPEIVTISGVGSGNHTIVSGGNALILHQLITLVMDEVLSGSDSFTLSAVAAKEVWMNNIRGDFVVPPDYGTPVSFMKHGGSGNNKDNQNNFNYGIRKMVFNGLYFDAHNNIPNFGTFKYDPPGALPEKTVNRDMFNIESRHPDTPDLGLYVINSRAKNQYDAFYDFKLDSWLVNSDYGDLHHYIATDPSDPSGAPYSEPYRATGIHGFSEGGNQPWRGQPVGKIMSFWSPEMSDKGNPASGSDTGKNKNYQFNWNVDGIWCKLILFNNWVGNRPVLHVDQADTNDWARVDNPGVLTEDHMEIISMPPDDIPDEAFLPFTKLGIRYRNSSGPGAWLYPDIGLSTGPFPVGAFQFTFDLSSVPGTSLDVEVGFGYHDAWSWSDTETLVRGGGLGPELLTNPDFVTTFTPWTALATWSLTNPGATHVSGNGHLHQTVTLEEDSLYRYEADVSDATATFVQARIQGDTAVSGPSLLENGRHKDHIKTAPLPENGPYTFRWIPNSTWNGKLRNCSLRKISYHGDV